MMHDALKLPFAALLFLAVLWVPQAVRAQDSDFGGIFEGVFEGLMQGGMDNGSDHHHHHHHNHNHGWFDDDDDGYYQGGYGNGQMYPQPAPAPQKPSQAVDITPPANLTPPKNAGLPEARGVSLRQMRDLELQLQEYIDEAVETLSRSLDPSANGRDFAQQLLDDLNGLGANPQLVSELERELRASRVDLTEVDRLGRDLGMTSASLDRLESGYQLDGELDQLKRMITDEEDSVRIAQAVNSLQRKARRRLSLASKGSETVFRQKLDSLSEACFARDLLTQRSGAKTLAWPTGEASVIYDPQTPDGEVSLLSQECLLVGAQGRLDRMQVGRGYASALLGVPTYQGEPVPDKSNAAIQQAGMLITNPTTVAFKFLIDGTKYELPAGFSQQIPLKAAELKFQNVRGKKEGWSKLNSGAYQFAYEQRDGWKIYSVKYQLWVVNRNNKRSFTYLVDNKTATVAPGAEKYHTSAWPIVVAFDRGDGSTCLKRFTSTAKNDTVVVPGFDAQNNRWDLFPQTATRVSTEIE
ncbi:MAG TPA: hypothetical protein VHC19_14545 [Pirellulales bacterium]|nr:hypothetical protein [Pirellulales bacterium]